MASDFPGAALWRKSSYSNERGGNCVEVAPNIPTLVPVRDSKVPGGPVLLPPPPPGPPSSPRSSRRNAKGPGVFTTPGPPPLSGVSARQRVSASSRTTARTRSPVNRRPSRRRSP
ncbi:DUF397 domain-containing protein [Streptomyces puniciscabiei]|uniref:DUF397 domain-containing protein n=1 Tax=Streptomyces puniciscabiei TaxID=164348 RepID=UPI0033242BF0